MSTYLCLGGSALIVPEGRNLKSMEYPQRYSVQGEYLFLCGDKDPTYWPGHIPNHIEKLFGQKMVMRLITLFPCFRFFFGVKTFAIPMLVVLQEPLQYPFLGSHTMVQNVTC
jgi:hypothetical protein